MLKMRSWYHSTLVQQGVGSRQEVFQVIGVTRDPGEEPVYRVRMESGRLCHLGLSGPGWRREVVEVVNTDDQDHG